MSDQVYVRIAENIDKGIQTAPKADGELSKAEIENASKALMGLDKNEDGKLDRTEMMGERFGRFGGRGSARGGRGDREGGTDGDRPRRPRRPQAEDDSGDSDTDSGDSDTDSDKESDDS